MAPIWGIRPVVGCRRGHPRLRGHRPRRRRQLLGRGQSAGVLVGLVVALTAAFFTDWSLLSMYLLLLAVVTFRSRGLAGKASILEQ